MSIYYLYVKTHCVTGLNYLGQTRSKDPHKYPGSGTYWKAHLKKHGANYTTQILKECHSHDELVYWGRYYSALWNVVISDQWANLKEESGDGGSIGVKLSAEHRSKMSQRMKGKNNPQYGKVSPFRGRTHSQESRSAIKAKAIGRTPHNKGQKMDTTFCAKISAAHHDVQGSNNPMWGKQHSEETKRKISEKARQRKYSDETKQKLSAIRKGRPWSEARRAAHLAAMAAKKST